MCLGMWTEKDVNNKTDVVTPSEDNVEYCYTKNNIYVTHYSMDEFLHYFEFWVNFSKLINIFLKILFEKECFKYITFISLTNAMLVYRILFSGIQ